MSTLYRLRVRNQGRGNTWRVVGPIERLHAPGLQLPVGVTSVTQVREFIRSGEHRLLCVCAHTPGSFISPDREAQRTTKFLCDLEWRKSHFPLEKATDNVQRLIATSQIRKR